ncbi:MAG: dTDP-4-dehydrorhamnose 3,5-epimerase [Bacteroidales bacterium]|jgi:dTDP-4-dehydrorhamnose 3,5-epimerase|nr:dTDP-4-dehydrorhamnose 3,5-epimerase [Bacteroidales bacterium]
MNISTTSIKGLLVIEPTVFGDDRGYFFESFSSAAWQMVIKQAAATAVAKQSAPIFVQDNESLSKKGVIRGLHFQVPPFAQDKLVRVVRGEALDVAVDLRHGSPTYGKHFSILLSGDNKKQFFIPKGFAHGFSVLEDDTIFAYKVSEFYHPEAEQSILFDDSTLGIDWKVDTTLVSDKDRKGVKFNDFITPFNNY